jgi:c-di-GMP-binding flagellar brake protein YcgR
MSTRERLPAAGELRVEATFKARGIAFRFGGAIEWMDGSGLIGIRFVELIPRRRDELIEVLRELEVEIAAKAEKEAAEKRAAEDLVRHEAERQASNPTTSGPTDVLPFLERFWGASADAGPKREPEPATAPLSQSSVAQQTGPRPPRPSKRERRGQSRHEVDTSADIFLINVGSRLTGRIQDLSVGGCRIRTDERFPVGIYTRVETEFRLEGLPFRLGGVIQAVHGRDRRLVGIRFLDMSSRKREQLEQLIEEIEELQGKQNIAKPGETGEVPVEG